MRLINRSNAPDCVAYIRVVRYNSSKPQSVWVFEAVTQALASHLLHPVYMLNFLFHGLERLSEVRLRSMMWRFPKCCCYSSSRCSLAGVDDEWQEVSAVSAWSRSWNCTDRHMAAPV
jgi:hypothetical protein